MKIAARETVPQIVLGDCSKNVGGVEKFNIYVILVKGEFMRSSAYLF